MIQTTSSEYHRGCYCLHAWDAKEKTSRSRSKQLNRASSPRPYPKFCTECPLDIKRSRNPLNSFEVQKYAQSLREVFQTCK